jgi:hypothetical protein
VLTGCRNLFGHPERIGASPDFERRDAAVPMISPQSTVEPSKSRNQYRTTALFWYASR